MPDNEAASEATDDDEAYGIRWMVSRDPDASILDDDGNMLAYCYRDPDMAEYIVGLHNSALGTDDYAVISQIIDRAALMDPENVAELVYRLTVMHRNSKRMISWMLALSNNGATPGDSDTTSAEKVPGDPGCTSDRDEWVCTRRAGHTGQHVSGDGQIVRAIWPNEEG